MGWLKHLFVGPETRSSFTDLSLLASFQNAEGAGYVGDVRHTAALEMCCRLYAAVFSVAKVIGPPYLVRALTATWRAQVVRAMIRGGEHVDVIESAPGGLELLPASLWTVLGGPRPSSWVYSCSLDGPSGTVTRAYAADDVVHLRWQTERGRPWVGIGPMQTGAAKTTGMLLGSLETRQSEEAASPVGAIIPVGKSDTDDPDTEAADPLYQLRNDIRNSRGRTLLPETQMGNGDPSQRPMSDWRSLRLGGNIPEAMILLRDKASMSVALSCGIPLSLVEVLATGIGQREGWRRFTLSSCAAVANLIADEVDAKIGVRPEFDLTAAYGSDLTGRASALQKMVGAGVPAEQALVKVGL